MVFFQAALLAGYAYAHAAPAWLGVRRHAVIHLLVLVAALGVVPLLLLPLRLPGWWPQPDDFHPILWLILLLLAARGCPLSSSRPPARCCNAGSRTPPPPAAARPLFPLWRQQSRQHPRTAGVSVPAGADAVAGEPGLAVGRRVRPADRADYGVCGVPVAHAAGRERQRPEARCSRRNHLRSLTLPARQRLRAPRDPARPATSPLDPAGLRAVEPHAQRHRLPQHRRGRRAAAVGRAADALPPDLRAGLRPPAAVLAADAHALDAAGGPAGRADAAVAGDGAAGPAAHRRPPAGPVLDRPRLSRRTGARPAAGRAADRVLHLHVGRRRPRRHVQRPRGAAAVPRCVGISDRPGAGVPPAAGAGDRRAEAETQRAQPDVARRLDSALPAAS